GSASCSRPCPSCRLPAASVSPRSGGFRRPRWRGWSTPGPPAWGGGAQRPRAARRVRLSEEWGLPATEMAWLVNAGALGLVSETVAAGATAADARKWGLLVLGRTREAGRRRL